MQIKFRIFSECGMWYPDEEPPHDGILSRLTLTQNGFVCEMMHPHDTEIQYYTEPDAYAMLWTGLKDCNGKDIYEGDIVDWTPESDTYRCKIQWNTQSLAWCMCHPEERSWSIWSMSLADVNNTNCAVVGNIHENPELLEGEDG